MAESDMISDLLRYFLLVTTSLNDLNGQRQHIIMQSARCILHHLTAGFRVSHGVASLRPLIPPEHCSGSTRSMDLGSLAVRQQVDPQLAAIALAASQRWGTGDIQIHNDQLLTSTSSYN